MVYHPEPLQHDYKKNYVSKNFSFRIFYSEPPGADKS